MRHDKQSRSSLNHTPTRSRLGKSASDFHQTRADRRPHRTLCRQNRQRDAPSHHPDLPNQHQVDQQGWIFFFKLKTSREQTREASSKHRCPTNEGVPDSAGATPQHRYRAWWWSRTHHRARRRNRRTRETACPTTWRNPHR